MVRRHGLRPAHQAGSDRLSSTADAHIFVPTEVRARKGPPTLVVGPRLGAVGMLQRAPRCQRSHNAECGAERGGRQRARVAVRQHAQLAAVATAGRRRGR